MALQRFVEYFQPDASVLKPTKAPITEAQRKLVEAQISHLREKFDLPEGKTVYRVPISRFDWINGNKRKYEGRLWQRVKEQQRDRYCGKIGLADHPPENSDGSFKESALVWLDIELDESQKLVWGYCVPVGPYGKLFEEIIEANGLPGFSSSGFGELDEDGCTVKAETYELERPADIVLTPSQAVYGDKTMIFQTPDGTTVEITPPSAPVQAPVPMATTPEPVSVAPVQNGVVSISDIVTPVQVSSTNMPAPPIVPATNSKGCGGYPESQNQNRSKAVATLSKLEERKLIKDINDFFNEAKSETNPIRKASRLKEVSEFFADVPAMTEDLKGLKEAIDKEIESTNKDVHTKIEESLKIEEEIGVKSVDELKSGLDKLAETTFSLNESADHWKQVAETLQKNVEELKAALSANPTVEEYETIVRELEKTDVATRKIVESQNAKILVLKKKLFEERNLSRNVEKECSEVKAQLESTLSAKKNYREKAVQFRDAYLRIVAKNKELIAEKKQMIEDVTDFLEGDMYRFGRDQKVAGSVADKIGKAVDFTQRQYVERYYQDLVRQYGKDIEQYRDRILSKKTYKEAVSEFTRIFSKMDEFRVPRGIEGDERREYLRESGIVIKDTTKRTKSAIRQILDEYKRNQ
jgi:hypothetical protein